MEYLSHDCISLDTVMNVMLVIRFDLLLTMNFDCGLSMLIIIYHGKYFV